MRDPASAVSVETDRFWKEFASLYWERQPLSLPDAPVQLEIGDDVLLRALALAADKANRPKGSGLPRVMVAVDGRTQPIDTRPFLPLPGDHSLDDYTARVDERLRTHEWSVAVSGLHAVDASLWDRAKRLSDDVYRYTGTRVAGRVDIDAFIGRYTSTNVGVHVDHAGNFGFTLRGRKSLLTWPPQRAEQVPQHTADYASARDLADVLVGVPGALTYFPSEQLHVGESPDSVAVNVNVAFFTRSDPAALVVDSLGGLLARTRVDAAEPGAHVVDDIPPAAVATLVALAELSGGEVEDVVWENHMRSFTSGGLGVGRPAGSPRPVPRDARVRIRRNTVVRQRLLTDGRRALATQGHTLKVAHHPHVEAAVTTLAAGETLDVAEWERRADSSAVPLLHAVLLRLWTWQAIDIEVAVTGPAHETEPLR